ncbi:response regulator transcription factor [Luedemannella flava]|uniref:Response regulator transcription factor n=1 Tax=Luedemannella flava TaxID=349316 RepID=A0ABN2LVV1_9ACTN
MTDEGYAVIATRQGGSAVEVARVNEPELLLLNADLPDVSGVEACRRIRSFSEAYVILIGPDSDGSDRIEGFSAGADDYLVRPYSLAELALRIRALRRRLRPVPTSRVRSYGSLQIDTGAREVTRDGVPVALTKIEFDLLETLSRVPHQTVSRDELLTGIWGSRWPGDDHVVDVHVGNLRRKLGETASAARHVHTVRGVGYRFEAA